MKGKLMKRPAETPNSAPANVSERAIRRAFTFPESKRTKTGQSAHFLKWKQDAAVKKHLQRMTVSWLAEAVQTKEGTKLSAPFFKLAAAYANVWDLSQAKRADLLNVPGLGAIGLGKVEEYLKSRNVELAWDATDAG